MTPVIAAGDYAAEAVRSELLAINEAHGVLTPELVVTRGRDPSSPLHAFFEWDDVQASEKFRLVQAGALIRRVKLTLIRASTETKVVTVHTTRAFVAPAGERKSKLNPEGGYAPIESVLSDEARRADLVATARRELIAVRRKYESLSELATVWAAIDEIET
jgi:hypothetical protein